MGGKLDVGYIIKGNGMLMVVLGGYSEGDEDKQIIINDRWPVSYTHLDVYKRQIIYIWFLFRYTFTF